MSQQVNWVYFGLNYCLYGKSCRREHCVILLSYDHYRLPNKSKVDTGQICHMPKTSLPTQEKCSSNDPTPISNGI